MTKISVIIPIYNVEEYIEECINSVINQTFKDIEIICINDGSPDNSEKIVKKLAKKDKRIKYISKNNEGLSATRNLGVKESTGEYIYFLDSDDYIQPDTLEKCYNYAEENNLEVVYFGADSFYDSEELKERESIYENYYKRQNIYEVAPGQQLFRDMLEKGEYRASIPMQFIKKSLITENNISFITGIIHEDEYYSLHLTMCSKASGVLNENFYKRRVRENSIMTSVETTNIKSSYGYFKTIKEIMPIIEEKVTKDYLLQHYRRYLSTLRNSSIRSLGDIKIEDLYKLEIPTRSLEEQLLYKFIIKDNLEQRKNITAVKRAANRKKNKKRLLLRIKRKLIRIRKKLVRFAKTTIKVTIPNIISAFKKKIKVSIIMPVYNVEDILEETLNYLIKQSTKKIEIICVDDGSSDNSLNILKEYETKYKNIKILQQNHEGAGAARNKGIKEAKGEYLLFLDSDDIFHKDLCKKSYNRAKLFNADIVLFRTNKYDEKTQKIIEERGTLIDKNIPKERPFSPLDVREELFQITTPCPWSKLFKKQFVLDNKLYFQNTKNANDVFFTLSALTQAKKIVMLNDTLVTYRIGQTNNLQATKAKNPLEFLKAYTKVREFLEEKGIYEDFKETFTTAAINSIIFNHRSTKTEESKREIRKHIFDHGLKDLGLENLEKENFKSQYMYYNWHEIMDKKEEK